MCALRMLHRHKTAGRTLAATPYSGIGLKQQTVAVQVAALAASPLRRSSSCHQLASEAAAGLQQQRKAYGGESIHHHLYDMRANTLHLYPCQVSHASSTVDNTFNAAGCVLAYLPWCICCLLLLHELRTAEEQQKAQQL